MFTLFSKDISVGGTTSASSRFDQTKNRFNLHFSNSKLDNRLLVRISPELISFFYYDSDYTDKEAITKDSSYEREVGSISLTRSEHTGRDILAFPQSIDGLKLFKAKESGLFKDIIDYNSLWKERFWGFPLAEHQITTKAESLNEEDKKEAFRIFLRYCLLCFILEFENRDMAFGESPQYNDVRDHLRKSEVYNLLSSKLHYTLYLHKEDSASHHQERYTFYTREFAEKLMSKSLVEAIPPENYLGNKKEVKQAWFYNPEDELENILNKNRSAKKKNGCELEESLVSSIRSFLYTKHAIFRAMTTQCSKILFWFSQGFMFLFNIGLGVICLTNFEDDTWNEYNDALGWIGVGVISLVLVCLAFSAFGKNKTINVFFPRIIVAEVTGWMTIGIVDDLIKSMLRISNPIWAIFGVLLLVGSLVFVETKQHSPYCHWLRNFWKSARILNHSVFFALLIGLVMQIFFYKNLLETSNVLSEVVYKEHFDKVGSYVRNLEELEKSINDYRGFVRDYEFGNTQMSGSNRGKTDIQGVMKLYSQGHAIDSLTLSLENKINIGTSLNPSVNEDVYSFHDALVENVNVSVKETHSIVPQMDSAEYKYFAYNLSKINPSKEERANIITANVRKTNELMPFIKKEIQECQKHLNHACFDTMITWATRGENVPDQYSSKYIKHLIANDTKQKHCFMIFGNRIFQLLLWLHMLVVLVLAFVGQLIVSDKSVTEPL